jgi:hypothetical protein
VKNFKVFFILMLSTSVAISQPLVSGQQKSTNQIVRESFFRLYQENPISAMTDAQVLGLELGMDGREVHSMTLEIAKMFVWPNNQVNQEIHSAILKIFATNSGRRIYSALKNSGLEKLNVHLHLVNNLERQVHSWSKTGSTSVDVHIFIANANLTEKKLIVLLTHELGQLVTGNDFSKIGPLLSDRFSRTSGIEKISVALVHDQLFRLAISTFRSYFLETVIASEMGLEYEALDFRGGQCAHSLKKIVGQLLFMAMPNGDRFGDSGKSLKTKHLRQFLSLLSDTESAENFCENLKSLEVDVNSCRPLGGGPRPATLGDP